MLIAEFIKRFKRSHFTASQVFLFSFALPSFDCIYPNFCNSLHSIVVVFYSDIVFLYF